MSSRLQVATVFGLLACLGGLPCHATTFTWSGPTGGDWFAATNWTPNGTPTSNDIVNVTGGSVNLSAPVTINNQFNWSGGTLTGLPITITVNGVLTTSGSGNETLQNALTNAGSIQLAGSVNLILDGTSGGGQLVNLPTGVINFPGFSWIKDKNAGSEWVRNQGTIEDTWSANQNIIYAPLTNFGIVSVTSGSFSLQGGGRLDGTFNASSGTSLSISAGNYTSVNGAALNGPGTFSFTGSSLLLSSNVSQNLALAGGVVTLGPHFQGGSITNLTISGATLAGSALPVSGALNLNGTTTLSLTVTNGGIINWGAGALSGSVNILRGGTLNILTNVTKYIDAPLTNAGTVTWLAGSLYVEYSTANLDYGSVQNLAGGLWDIQNDAVMSSDYPNGAYFQNNGVFRKSVGSGNTSIAIPFNNLGTVSNLTQTITFNGGGVLQGAFNASAGTTLQFDTGNFTAGPSPAFTGTGLMQLNGANVTLLNDTFTNFQFARGSVTLGPQFQGGAITNLTLGIVTLNGSNYIVTGTFTSSGTLTPNLTVASNGVMNWSGNPANGWIDILKGGALNLNAGNFMTFNQPLTNAGTVTWISGNIEVDNSSASSHYGLIDNLAGALWDIKCDAQLGFVTSSNGVFFQNSGTFQKSGGSGATMINLPFYNSGTVTMLTHTVTFNYGGILGGTFNAAAGTVINFNSGNFFAGAPPPVVTGAGLIEFSGGNFYLGADTIPNLQFVGGTVNLGPNFQGGLITNFTLAGATLGGTNYVVTGVFNYSGTLLGALTVSNGATVNWSGGAATAPFNVLHGGTLNIIGGVNLWNALTNAGTVNCSGAGNLDMDYSSAMSRYGQIQNLAGAQWVFSNSVTLYNSYPNGAYFQNAGAVVKNAAGATAFNIPFYNSGMVIDMLGTLNFNDGGVLGGSFSAAAGASIIFAGGTFDYTIPPVVSGPGAVQLTGGELTLLNDIIPNLQLAGGTVDLGPNFQGGAISNLTLLGATLNGSSYTVTGSLTFNGSMIPNLAVARGATLNWSGGAAYGWIDILSGGTMNISGGSTKYIYAGVTNAGVVTWTGQGNLNVDYSSANLEFGFIQNLAGAFWDMQKDETIENDFPNGAYFQNAGVFRKSAGTGNSYISIPFYNSGSVLCLTQTMVFNASSVIGGTFNASAGAQIEFNIANFSYSTPPAISGSGTVELLGGTLTLLKDVIPNLQLAGGAVNLGPGFQGGVISNLTLNGATLNGSAFTVTGTLNFGGNVSQEAILANLTVASNATVNWSAGSAEGWINVLKGGTLNLLSGTSKYLYEPLTNAGTVTWSGGSFYVDNSSANNAYALVQNLASGVWNMQSDQEMLNNYNNGAYFQNAGMVIKSGGSSTTGFYIPYSNLGTTAADQATIAFNAGFSANSGTLIVGLGTNANDPGQFSISGSATLGGTLDVVWNGGFVPANGAKFTLVSYGSHTGTFSPLSLPAPATWQTNYGASALTAQVTDIARLVVSSAALDTNAGGILRPVTVQASDAVTGNPIVGATVTISLATGSGTVSGAVTGKTDAMGKVVFNDLFVNLVGEKSLRASAPGLSPATSVFFIITPALPAQLAIVTPIATGQNDGKAFLPAVVVQVEDRFGNITPASTAPITAQLSSGGGGVLGGTTVVNANGSSGAATFQNLIYNLANHLKAESMVTYFTSPGLLPATNAPVTVNFDFGLITLRNGNSAVQINPTTQSGLLSWTVDGVEQAYQQWYWLRQGSTGGQASFDTLGIPIGSATAASSAAFYYLPSGLTVSLGYSLSGGQAGSGASVLSETVSLQNTSNSPVTLHLFQYSDFDLDGQELGDVVSFPASNSVVQTGKGVILTETAPTPPSFWESSFYGITFDKIAGSSPATLSDQVINVAPGDQTYGYQWDVTLAAGQVFSLNLTNSIRKMSGSGQISGPPQVALAIALSDTNVVISWPVSGAAGFYLQSSALDQGGAWENVAAPPTTIGANYQVVVPLASGPQFYRLKN